MYHIIRLHFLVDWDFLQVHIFIFIVLTVVLVPHGPHGQGLSTDPPYRQDAKKGNLPSVPFPHAGPEPSGYAPRSFLKGNSLDPKSPRSSQIFRGKE